VAHAAVGFILEFAVDVAVPAFKLDMDLVQLKPGYRVRERLLVPAAVAVDTLAAQLGNSSTRGMASVAIQYFMESIQRPAGIGV